MYRNKSRRVREMKGYYRITDRKENIQDKNEGNNMTMCECDERLIRLKSNRCL